MARLPSTPKLFTNEKRKFIVDKIKTERVMVGGRPRSVVHVRTDVIEVQNMMDYDGDWIFSDRRLQDAYEAAVKDYDESGRSQRSSNDGEDESIIQEILNALRKRRDGPKVVLGSLIVKKTDPHQPGAAPRPSASSATPRNAA